MQRVRHDFLAGAGLAFDEHRGPRRRHLLHQLGHPADLGGFPDQIGEFVGLPDLLGELLVLRFQRAAAQRALELHFHLVEIERLGHEMPGPAAHRFDRRVHRAVGRHHDRHRWLGQCQRGVQQIHPGVPAQTQVGE